MKMRLAPIDILGRTVLGVVAAISLLLLVAPSLIVIAISFEPRGYIAFPPSGFSLRWYQSLLGNRQLTDSIVVSLYVSLAVAGRVPSTFSRDEIDRLRVPTPTT